MVVQTTQDNFALGANALLLLPIVLVVTIAVSIPLLGGYRKAVLSSMLKTVGRARDKLTEVLPVGLGTSDLAAAGPAHVRVVEQSSSIHLSRQAKSYVREAIVAPVRLAILYSLSGLVFAVIMSLITLWGNHLEISSGRLAVTTLLFAWPVIPTVLYLVPLRIGVAVGLVSAYAAALLLSANLGPYVSTGDVLKSALATLAVPTVVGLILASRRLRAVAPFVFAVVFVFGLFALFGLWTFASLVLGGRGFMFALASGLLLLAAGAGFAWWLVPLNAQLYRNKKISDQMFIISTWWLLFALWGCLLLSVPRNVLALVGILGWFGFITTLGVGLKVRGDTSRAPARLLLLRVFGPRRRAEKLLAALARYWQHVGSIQLIAGTDLATSNLEPHEFLEFLTRRIGRRFVRDEEDLARRLGDMDWRPDPDSRYRINELFCHNDTWRMAVTRLVDESDVVLMDLRGFSRKNEGVVFEISHLLNAMSTRKLLFLVDDTSDLEALKQVVDGAWRQMSADSPNKQDSDARVSVFRFARVSLRNVRSILEHLSSSVALPETV